MVKARNINSTGVARRTSTAPIERAHSDRARSGSIEVILTTRSSLPSPRRRARRNGDATGQAPPQTAEPAPPEGAGRLFFTARIERPPFSRGGSASKKNGLPTPSHFFEAERCASRRTLPPLASNYTVKYCFTCSALNSVLLPDTTTAPLAITTYFSARRAAKWSPCSTNKMANRRCFLNPMITSSI